MMEVRWVVFCISVCCFINKLHASLYDDDYDSYTKAYDYKTAGKRII